MQQGGRIVIRTPIEAARAVGIRVRMVCGEWWIREIIEPKEVISDNEDCAGGQL